MRAGDIVGTTGGGPAEGPVPPEQFFQFSLQDPKVIIGLFIGGLLPFIFTAFSMDAVGKAAGAVVREVRRQLKE